MLCILYSLEIVVILCNRVVYFMYVVEFLNDFLYVFFGSEYIYFIYLMNGMKVI